MYQTVKSFIQIAFIDFKIICMGHELMSLFSRNWYLLLCFGLVQPSRLELTTTL